MDSSEQVLAQNARNGDLQAYGELVGTHQAAVFNVCLRLLGERREAEDQAQEAFIRAYSRLHLYDASRPFGPWIRRLAANLCLNRLEEQRRLELPLDEAREETLAAAPGLGPEERLTAAEQSVVLRRAILGLPPAYRAVIELRHFQELSYEEIADNLKLSLSDVKSHLFRARKMLAARITAHE
jgi:RNA polymerase sigma-70 factor (ECF subfamily)